MTKPLRILFINRMASLERGGGETFDLEVSRHLSMLGHKITFLTGIPLFGSAKLQIGDNIQNPTSNVQLSGPDKLHIPSQINNIQLRSPYFGWFPWDKVKGGWRLRVADFTMFEWRAARWAYKHRDEFDIIQICELPNIVCFLKSIISDKKLRFPKLVVRLTAPNYHDPRKGIPMADGIIASGTSLAKLRTRGLGRAVNIPNGVDTDRFRPQSSNFRDEHHIEADEIVILYVARFQEFKNHAMLVRAFAELVKEVKNVRLLLAGSGPLRGAIEQQISAAGLSSQVIILGECPFDSLPWVYASANINAITSNYESFCFAAIEGMASGLPVISTDCGWVPELIGDSLPPIEKEWVVNGGDLPANRFEHEVDGKRIRDVPGGLVTARNDHHSFSVALKRLVKSKAERNVMGGWNREKAVSEHRWTNSAQMLEIYYTKLLQTPSFGDE